VAGRCRRGAGGVGRPERSIVPSSETFGLIGANFREAGHARVGASLVRTRIRARAAHAGGRRARAAGRLLETALTRRGRSRGPHSDRSSPGDYCVGLCAVVRWLKPPRVGGRLCLRRLSVAPVQFQRGKAIFYSPGTFVGRQLPPESEGGEITDLVRSLLADMSPDGFVTVLELDDSGRYDLRMIPTSLDGNGLPVVATGTVLGRIAGRVIGWSERLGARVELVDGELRSARPGDDGGS
jgi:hypothetical protein